MAKINTPSSEEQLRQRREQLGLSRQKVSQMTGLKMSRIWASEQPNIGVSPEEREIIAKSYNDHAAEIGGLPPIK